MAKRIIGSLLAALLLLNMGTALAEPEASPTPTATVAATAKPLIPETVDLGRLNSLAPMTRWPWQQLEVVMTGGSGETAYLDILVEDEALADPWQGLSSRRLAQDGLTREDILPLVALAPEGWAGILTHLHRETWTEGSLVGTEGSWLLRRGIPHTFRLAVYFPARGTGFVTDPVTVRQYQSRVVLDAAGQSARVMKNPRSGPWLAKLALRLLLAGALTLLVSLLFLDTGRKLLLGIKALSAALYFLLVLLFPGLFSGNYPLAMFLVQALLSLGEAACVWYGVSDKKWEPAALFGGISLVTSLALGLWWLC